MLQLNSTVAIEDFVKVHDILLSGRHESQPDLTSGTEAFDRLLTLNFGQFVAFMGK
jgi:hypothetical protein